MDAAHARGSLAERHRSESKPRTCRGSRRIAARGVGDDTIRSALRRGSGSRSFFASLTLSVTVAFVFGLWARYEVQRQYAEGMRRVTESDPSAIPIAAFMAMLWLVLLLVAIYGLIVRVRVDT